MSAMSDHEEFGLVNLHMQVNKPITESPLLMSSYISHLTQLRCSNWASNLPVLQGRFFYVFFIPPVSKESREVANSTERKNLRTPVYSKYWPYNWEQYTNSEQVSKNLSVCLSVCLSVTPIICRRPRHLAKFTYTNFCRVTCLSLFIWDPSLRLHGIR